MKASPTNSRLARVLCAGMAVGMTTAFAAETPKQESGFLEKAEQLHNKMSEAFRDTWKSLRSTRSDASVSTASVDLREQKDNYVAAGGSIQTEPPPAEIKPAAIVAVHEHGEQPVATGGGFLDLGAW